MSTEQMATPSSRWAADGLPDPHGDRYDCERAALALGHLTDDELANAVYLHGNEQPSMADLVAGKALSGIVYLTAAKERIRWLSRALAATGKQQVGDTGCGACGNGCVDRPACRVAEESPPAQVGEVQGDALADAVGRIFGCDGSPYRTRDLAVVLREFAARQPGAQVPAGWKLVPELASEEQLRAALDTGVYHDGEDAARAVLADEYRTMVAAAPPAQGIDLGQLQRYDLDGGFDHYRGLPKDKGAHLYVDATGEWVKWDDVEALIDQRGAAPRVGNVSQPNEPGRTLYVDLDGVMADFDGAFPAVFGLDHRSLADEEMWGHINSHASFFRDLPPMAGAIEFFRSIEHLNPVILTACPKSNYAHVAAQKRAWVREHLSQTCLVLPVMGGRHKPLFMHQPGDILIDDWGKNCAAWTEAGGVAIKHEGDWAETRVALAHTGVLS